MRAVIVSRVYADPATRGKLKALEDAPGSYVKMKA